MAAPYTRYPSPPGPAEPSIGDLFGELGKKLQVLLQKEVELAKLELQEEASKAAKGGAAFGAMAAVGYLALILLSFAAAWPGRRPVAVRLTPGRPTGARVYKERPVSNLTWRTTGVVALVVALLGGCGSSSGKASLPSTVSTVSGAPSALGSPGDSAKATRTVAVHAGDDLKFQPASIAVKVGETITFQVVNDGKAQHDFVLGDATAQADHQASMAGMQPGSQMLMPDVSNAVHIPGGQTKSITWTFTTPGSTLYGSHEPGDYAGGMKGTITVS